MPRFHVVRVKQSTDPESAQLGSTREIDRAEDGALLRERAGRAAAGGGFFFAPRIRAGIDLSPP